jgi:mannan endo-1,4-beta-mannosidase
VENPPQNDIPWMRAFENAPYSKTDDSMSWRPIGQNDAGSWPDSQGLFLRREAARVEGHGLYCSAWLELHQDDDGRLPRQEQLCRVAGFKPTMVIFFKDLFCLCKKHKLRLLIKPFNTFWMARSWKCYR